MKAARRWWPSKVAPELAVIIGCDVRSAERYLAGDRTPDAEAILSLIGSDIGDKLITVAIAEMSWERQRRFWDEMAKAARRFQLRDQLEAIENELAATNLGGEMSGIRRRDGG